MATTREEDVVEFVAFCASASVQQKLSTKKESQSLLVHLIVAVPVIIFVVRLVPRILVLPLLVLSESLSGPATREVRGARGVSVLGLGLEISSPVVLLSLPASCTPRSCLFSSVQPSPRSLALPSLALSERFGRAATSKMWRRRAKKRVRRGKRRKYILAVASTSPHL